jgi:hypothetical protein
MDQYFLHVESIVAANKSEEYENNMVVFRGSDPNHQFFANIVSDCKYKLCLGLRTDKPFKDPRQGLASLSGAERGPAFEHSRLGPDRMVYRHINVWKIDALDAVKLAEMMRICSDNELYMKINRLLLSESQNFVRGVAWQLPPSRWRSAQGAKHELFRVVRTFGQTKAGQYLFDLLGLMPLFESQGLHLICQFQPITGLLGTIYEYWETDGKGEVPEKLDAICRKIPANRPKLRKLAESIRLDDMRTVQFLQRAKYAPALNGKPVL